VIGNVQKKQKNLIGMNYNYRSYITIYGRSHVSATIRNSDYNIERHESMTENNITHASNDTTIVSIETHMSMDGTK
jgi:hypothetical protein